MLNFVFVFSVIAWVRLRWVVYCVLLCAFAFLSAIFLSAFLWVVSFFITYIHFTWFSAAEKLEDWGALWGVIQQRVILNIVKHFGWSWGEFDNSFSFHYVSGVLIIDILFALYILCIKQEYYVITAFGFVHIQLSYLQ